MPIELRLWLPGYMGFIPSKTLKSKPTNSYWTVNHYWN